MGLIVCQALIMASKDTKLFFKDRFAVAFSFGFPFLFIIGFSLALANVGPEDESLELTIATREADGISRLIIDGLIESPDISLREMSYEDALQAVEDDELTGFIAFSADFTSNVTSGNPVALEVVARNDVPSEEAALEGFALGIAGRISNSQIAIQAIIELQVGQGGLPNIDFESLGLFDGEQIITFDAEQVGDVEPFNASNFTLPGYLTMFVFFAAAMAAESIILGKYIGTAYRGLMQLAVLWVIGILAFRIDLGVSPAAVILISVFMVLASAGFGVMLASIVKTQRSASSVGVLASLILAPIGGSWWPLFITPDWMQSLGKLTPHGWANTAFNNLMLFGAEFGDVVTNMVALVVFALVFVGVALIRFRLSAA